MFNAINHANPIKTVKKGSVSHMSYKDVKSSVCDREVLK